MKYLLIQKASYYDLWYRDRVGETLQLVSTDEDFHWVADESGFPAAVDKNDAIIVDRPTTPESVVLDGASKYFYQTVRKE